MHRLLEIDRVKDSKVIPLLQKEVPAIDHDITFKSQALSLKNGRFIPFCLIFFCFNVQMGRNTEEIKVYGIKNAAETCASDGEIFNTGHLSILTNRLLKRAKSGFFHSFFM